MPAKESIKKADVVRECSGEVAGFAKTLERRFSPDIIVMGMNRYLKNVREHRRIERERKELQKREAELNRRASRL